MAIVRTRRIPAGGRLGLPDIEVVELVAGGGRMVKLRAGRPGWFGQLNGAHTRFMAADQVLLEIVETVPTESGHARAVLQVRPGMEGEIAIGVARMNVGQILADPSLRQADGSARLPLPNGSRVRITTPEATFLARVGGAPFDVLPGPSEARSLRSLITATRVG